MSPDTFASTLNSFTVQKDVIWGMILLIRQAPLWAVFTDTRLQTVALWVEFQSEVKEKKFHEFDPEACGSAHFSTEGVSFLNWELFLWLKI